MLGLRPRRAAATRGNSDHLVFSFGSMMVSTIPGVLPEVTKSEKKLPKVLAVRNFFVPLPP